MVVSAGSQPWFRCISCNQGMDANLSKCMHCGYEHSDSELEELKAKYSRKQHTGLIISIVVFPLIIFFLCKYFEGM